LESYQAQGMTRGAGGAYRDVEGNRGQFEFDLQCYGRTACAQRGKPVIKEMDGPHKRTIWYTEEQLFMPRIMRYGDAYEEDGEDIKSSTKTTPKVSTVVSAQKRSMNSESGGSNDAWQASESSSSDPVDALLTRLKDDGWKQSLSSSIQSDQFRDLARFIQSERNQGAVIYPPEEDIFSALNLCPLKDVKVVIVGQDPYHGPGQGHGLSFSVRPNVRPPPSLKNIFKEAQDDVGIEPPANGYLECWAEQGVLLLNAVLTVRKGEANSHAKKGWESFTDAIIDTLNEEKEGLVFLLWGSPAQKKASNVDESKHTVIRTSHPSPLGATKTKSPFLGSRCFSRTNEALESVGKDAIDWNVR
jgi:uracil-DNA glycosylase